jgi:hypothetical protein
VDAKTPQRVSTRAIAGLINDAMRHCDVPPEDAAKIAELMLEADLTGADAHGVFLGLGPVDFIAQNGIQIGYGAKAQVQNDFVSGNAYSGTNFASSGGVLVVGGDCYGGPLTTNLQVQNNTGIGNDVGVWLSNLDASCNSPSAPTKNTAQNNELINNEVTNISGDGPKGYQAGIAVTGNGDTIQNNDTCGPGYTPPGPPTADVFAIDAASAINAKVKNNTVCGQAGNLTMSALSRVRAHGHRAAAPAK